MTFTDDANSRYNWVVTPETSWIEGSNTEGFIRYSNRNTDSRGLAFYSNSTSLFDHADDDWTLNLAANQIYTKAATDTEARVYIWNTLGRLYFGPGGSTAAAMYFQAESSTVLGFNGGDIDMNANDIIGLAVAGNAAAGSRIDFQNSDVIVYDGDNAKRAEFLNGGDIILYDEDGTTAQLTWDETNSRWSFNSSIFMEQTAEIRFEDAAASGDLWYMAASATDEFKLSSNFTADRTVLRVYSEDHATTPGDINFYSPDDSDTILSWDESNDHWVTTKEVVANKPTRYTTAQTLTTADRAVISDSAGSITHTLPALSGITEFPHMIVIGAFGAGNAVIDPGTDNIDGTTGDVTLTGGESPPASVTLVAWDTTDDWTTWATQGTVTQA